MKSVKIAAGIFAASMLIAGPAFADGPSGSKESSGNNVTCNRTSGGGATGGNIYANGTSVGGGAGGLETCSDTGPIQGRIIVSSSGSVAADGDKDNPSEAQGWAKVSASGATCGDGDSTKEKGGPCGA